MLVVNIANELWLENSEPKHVSIPAIAYWVRSNIGKLNSLLYEDFWVNFEGNLEIYKGSQTSPCSINHRAVAILKVMFKVYLLDLDLRRMIFSATSDTILKATDQEFSVEKINKSELLKTLAALKKETLKELIDLVHTYRSFYGTPSQVSGDDFIGGQYLGVEWDYVRNI